MSGTEGGKSLKEQNRPLLWVVLAANWVIFYAVAQAGRLTDLGLQGLLTGVANLLPVGLATIVTLIADGFFPTKAKERLAFRRWHHALPGHRAFTYYAQQDPRIDLEALKRELGCDLPNDPREQNATWYRLFKAIENDPAVYDTHRIYLFARDCTGLAAIALVVFSLAVMFAALPWSTRAIYAGCLLIQLLLTQQAAATYGGRLVCTVLARTAAAPPRA